MQSMAAAIGVSVPVLRFLLCFAATIPVSFFHRVVPGSLPKHMYAALSGAILFCDGGRKVLSVARCGGVARLEAGGDGDWRRAARRSCGDGDWSWEQVDWREAAGDLGDGTKLLGLGFGDGVFYVRQKRRRLDLPVSVG
ncbi:unnamed protein product [Linum tenue]|uniref:Uncharacterized protein n=1 Tax=Linum tenue TaxID=586396 RepID=A0AAV0NXI0_9ROSI|nr:unnamed protein product [Linum tenue]